MKGRRAAEETFALFQRALFTLGSEWFSMEAPSGAAGNTVLPLELRIISKVELNLAVFHLKDIAKCLQFNLAASPRTVMSWGFEGVKYWAAHLKEIFWEVLALVQLESGRSLPMLETFSPVSPSCSWPPVHISAGLWGSTVSVWPVAVGLQCASLCCSSSRACSRAVGAAAGLHANTVFCSVSWLLQWLVIN